MDAENLLGKGKYNEALDKVALAFTQLIDDYEDRKRDQFGRSPFFFGKSVSFVGHVIIGQTYFEMIPDEIIDSIQALQNAFKILSLNIDYRRYARFRLMTPIILRMMSGKYDIQRIKTGLRGILTKDDIQFYINFVIESAVTLQEFDF